MPKFRISLASKCQILFGAAVVLILSTALTVLWLRMQALVQEGQREIASQLADAWLGDEIDLNEALDAALPVEGGSEQARVRMRLIDHERLELAASADGFIERAMHRFQTQEAQRDAYDRQRDREGHRVYRYARAIRQRDLEPARGGFAPDLPPTQVANPLRAILLIEMPAEWASHERRLNLVYLVTAGLLASLLAIAVFWLVTTRIILSPVRVLRDTAEKVAEGDLNIRSDINTGDEFEQLSETFNTMLSNLKTSQDKLRMLNKQLDLRLGELARSNLSLHEANRLKGDFLANVSHELRTPLNSIIGFAELLSDSLGADAPPTQRARLRRYVDHIAQSSRSLLQMINELLDLAKIEAGRMELHVDRLSVADICETLLNLIRPQADQKQIALAARLERRLPIVQTDPGKFQQILFNFLSNAVKFTPAGGRVVLGAEAIVREPAFQPTAVRVWVSDTGPGIPVERHELIFDKFRQLDGSHTKEHGGTGLGLAISRELARLLQGRIELDSDVGRGTTFSLIIPLVLSEESEPLMPEATR